MAVYLYRKGRVGDRKENVVRRKSCGCTGDRIAGKQQWAGIAVWCFRTLGEE